jgi:hypothetical protein
MLLLGDVPLIYPDRATWHSEQPRKQYERKMKRTYQDDY